MECQKKEMQLADDEDFGSHCLGKSSSLDLRFSKCKIQLCEEQFDKQK